MNGVHEPQPQTQKTPEQAKLDDLWRHMTRCIKHTSQKYDVPIQQLCVCVASNLKDVFAKLDDLHGLRVYSHPLIPEGKVEIRPRRRNYGEKRINDLWEELRRI